MAASRTSKWLGVWALVGAMGCNGFTGAEGLDLGADDDDASSSESGQTPSPKVLSCAYPIADSFGADLGQTLQASLGWEFAFRAGEADARRVNLTELYDCDGSKGIHGVMFITSQFFCAACEVESAALPAEKALWDAQGLGIEVVELILNNPDDSHPPTLEAAKVWREKFGLYSVTVAADMFSLVVGGSVGTPQMTIVDPRTMEVVMRKEGYAGPQQYQTLIDLAKQNRDAAND